MRLFLVLVICVACCFGNCRASLPANDSIAGVAAVDSVGNAGLAPVSVHPASDSLCREETDSQYRFRPTQLIAPGVLLAAGIAGTYAMDDFNNSVRDHLSGYKKGRSFRADDYMVVLPGAAYLGLGFIPGVKARGCFKDRFMAGVTAGAVMAVTVGVMKYTFRHPRPGSGSRDSFPSGHSAVAFAGAELMRIEYGNYIGCAGYAVAAAVGFLRIYNDRHWITDVFGGAAIGILSARVGYWLLPWEQKIFKLDKKNDRNKSLAILPMLGETNGMAFSMQF